MQTQEPKPEDLTREKNLWQVYRQAIRFGYQKGALIFASSMAVLSVVGLVLFRPDAHVIAESVRAIADKGLDSALNLIALLAAGFTFYAALGDKKLFVRMANTTNKIYSMSYFKYFMFVFLKGLAEIWFFLVLCLIILFFGSNDGFVSQALRFLPSAAEKGMRYLLSYFALSIMVWLSTFIIASLTSFVFNIYYVVAFGTRWEWESKSKSKHE